MTEIDLYENNKRTYIRLLISRNLARFTNMAFSIYFMWEIVYIYHSVFLVSLIPGFSLLGYLIIAIPEGVIIDRYNRNKIYIIINAFMVFSYLILIKDSLYSIYIVDLISSTIIWVISDDFRGIEKQIIPPEKMEHVQSMDMLSSGLFMLAGIILGGVFIFIGYNYLTLFLVSVSIIELLLSIKNTTKKLHITDNKNAFKFKSTVKITASILPFLLLGLLLNGMFIALDVFASGLIHIIMHAPSYYYTLFVAGYPAGMLIGGVISMNPRVNAYHGRKNSMALYIFISGIIFILIAINRMPVLDGVLTFIIGVFLAFINILLESKLINGIPDSIMGKFNSLATMFSISSSPVMAFAFGYLSEFVYFPYILLFAGIVVAMSSLSVKYVMNSFERNIKNIEIDFPELINGQ
ncbi:MAG: hypothetical protein QXZ44_00525 [Ferroplasma sp.]